MPAACWTHGGLEHAVTTAFATNIDLSPPTGYQTGHLVLFFIQMGTDISGGNTAPPAASTPSGWTKIIDQAWGTTPPSRASRFMLFGRVLDGTESFPVNFSNGEPRTEWLVMRMRFDGADWGDVGGPDSDWLDDFGVFVGGQTDSSFQVSLTAELQPVAAITFHAQTDNASTGVMPSPGTWCKLHDIERPSGWFEARGWIRRITANGAVTWDHTGHNTNSDKAALAVLVPLSEPPTPTNTGQWSVSIGREHD